MSAYSAMSNDNDSVTVKNTKVKNSQKQAHRCDIHRRRSQGARGLQPPDSDKTIIFRAKDKFFGQKPAAKMKQKCFFVFIK